MTGATDNMVLRTVYLPPDLDDRLKAAAYHGSTTKGDLIRKAIAQYLAALNEAQP